MRIVIYTFEFLPFSGGIATYCHELACGLSALGHHVTVVAPGSEQFKLGESPYRIEWIRSSRARVFLMVNGVRTLRRTVKSHRPDVVLATDQYALISLSLFGASIRVTSVPIIHGSEILRHSNDLTLLRRIVAWNMKRFYGDRSLVICVSAYSRSLFLSKFAIVANRVVVVHNGMKDRFNPDIDRGDQVRRQWRILESTTVLLTLARLVPRKGQDVIIRALSRVIEKHGEIVYMCAGTGSYKETLVRLAHDHGVQNHVIFTGRVPEEQKYSYYNACDLFVMVSRQHENAVEGFGLSFLEAWHASKPVLGGRHGGVPEVIEDGVDGRLVDADCVESVADVIVSMVRAPSELREMGRRGHEKAHMRFTEIAMATLVVNSLRERIDY